MPTKTFVPVQRKYQTSGRNDGLFDKEMNVLGIVVAHALIRFIQTGTNDLYFIGVDKSEAAVQWSPCVLNVD